MKSRGLSTVGKPDERRDNRRDIGIGSSTSRLLFRPWSDSHHVCESSARRKRKKKREESRIRAPVIDVAAGAFRAWKAAWLRAKRRRVRIRASAYSHARDGAAFIKNTCPYFLRRVAAAAAAATSARARFAASRVIVDASIASRARSTRKKRDDETSSEHVAGTSGC